MVGFERAIWLMTKLFICIEGEQLNVGMSHIQTLDMHGNFELIREDRLQSLRYQLGDRHNSRVIFIGQIPDRFDLDLRHHQNLAWLDRVDVHKNVGAVVFVNFMARDLAFDDAGKD